MQALLDSSLMAAGGGGVPQEETFKILNQMVSTRLVEIGGDGRVWTSQIGHLVGRFKFAEVVGVAKLLEAPLPSTLPDMVVSVSRLAEFSASSTPKAIAEHLSRSGRHDLLAARIERSLRLIIAAAVACKTSPPSPVSSLVAAIKLITSLRRRVWADDFDKLPPMLCAQFDADLSRAASTALANEGLDSIGALLAALDDGSLVQRAPGVAAGVRSACARLVLELIEEGTTGGELYSSSTLLYRRVRIIVGTPGAPTSGTWFLLAGSNAAGCTYFQELAELSLSETFSVPAPTADGVVALISLDWAGMDCLLPL